MITITFDTKAKKGAINFPENFKTPEQQIDFIEQTLKDGQTYVTVSPFIVEAIFYYATIKGFEKEAFVGNKRAESEDIFKKMTKPLEKLVWDKIIE